MQDESSHSPLKFYAALKICAAYQLVLLALVALLCGYQITTGKISSFSFLFAQWDAKHYLAIAKNWYQAVGEERVLIVFFPLYPILIWCLSNLMPAILAGFIISNSASIVGHAAFAVYLSELGFSRKVLWRTMGLLFVSPIAVYFTNLYSESLYLALTAGFLLLLQRQKMFSAGVLGFLASFTRLMGVLTILPFALANVIFQDKRPTLRSWFWFAPVILGGLAIYLLINYQTFGDAFHYSLIQKQHWSKAAVNPLGRYWWEFRSAFINGSLWSNDNYSLILDHLLILLAPFVIVAYLIVPRQDKVKLPYYITLWCIAQLTVISSQTFWLSSTRYVALILPLYIMLERILRFSNWAYYFILSLSASIGLWAAYRFSLAWWVF